MPIKTSSFCACGSRNDVYHAFSCKKGGYTIHRHNNIRNFEAEFTRDVRSDAKVEPSLIPLDADLMNNGNNTDKAKLHVSVLGLWAPWNGHSLISVL